eukprot:10873171-Alexandrium_andersonii.AAC.1
MCIRDSPPREDESSRRPEGHGQCRPTPHTAAPVAGGRCPGVPCGESTGPCEIEHTMPAHASHPPTPRHHHAATGHARTPGCEGRQLAARGREAPGGVPSCGEECDTAAL